MQDFSSPNNISSCPTSETEFQMFINQIIKALSSRPGKVVESPIRASVALVLRINGFREEDFVKADANNLPFAMRNSTPENVQLLFIRRLPRPGDKWSHQVAFPGGKRDPEDEDDVATAIREVFEECGLKLKRENLIGSLNQRPVFSSGRATPGFTYCPYIFLLDSADSTLKLQPGEIEGAVWVPLKLLRKDRIDPRGVERPYSVPPANLLPKSWHHFFGVDRVYFPALPIPVDGPGAVELICPSAEEISNYLKDTNNLHSEIAKMISTMPEDPTRDLSHRLRTQSSYDPFWSLWGMTLSATSDFLVAIDPDAEVLNSPAIHLANPPLEFFAGAYYGYKSLVALFTGKYTYKQANKKAISKFFLALSGSGLALYMVYRAVR